MSASQPYKFKGKSQFNQKALPPLSEDKKAEMRAKASCFIVVKFQDGNEILRWSKEFQHPNKGDINWWINDWIRVFNKYWKLTAVSAALYDARYVKVVMKDKSDPNYNKLYQYNAQNKQWEAENR